jgi:hypothetical protein
MQKWTILGILNTTKNRYSLFQLGCYHAVWQFTFSLTNTVEGATEKGLTESFNHNSI